MKIRLHFLTLFVFFIGRTDLIAQETSPTHMLNLYWDDDYLNLQGKGTDRAYSSGQRIDFFYMKKRSSGFFMDRVMPKAGSQRTDIYSWSLMQVMVTPDNISDPNFQPNDYPWSGALFVAHSLYSYNGEGKFAFKSEALLGVMGPASLAGQTQRLVHRLIHYREPEGWSNQFGNTPLMNAAFSAEKQEWGCGKFLEVIGGARIDAGAMMDELTVYQYVRIGIMDPYFDGLSALRSASGKSRRRTGFYLFMKPQAQAVAYDAFLQGSIFSSKKTLFEHSLPGTKAVSTPTHYHEINHLVFEEDYGCALSVGNVTIAYTQKPTSAYMKGLYDHNVGNITISKFW
jgi:lipid A 3-O-deacylase